jgi:hypothetical protein
LEKGGDAMSEILRNFDVSLSGRKEEIIVKEVKKNWVGRTNKLSFIEITDTVGRKHSIFFDALSASKEIESWKNLKSGDKISLILKESVISAIIQPCSPRPVFSKDADYSWQCSYCKKRGEVIVQPGDDPKATANRIYMAHSEASPDCNPKNVKVLFGNLEQKGLEELVARELMNA